MRKRPAFGGAGENGAKGPRALPLSTEKLVAVSRTDREITNSLAIPPK